MEWFKMPRIKFFERLTEDIVSAQWLTNILRQWLPHLRVIIIFLETILNDNPATKNSTHFVLKVLQKMDTKILHKTTGQMQQHKGTNIIKIWVPSAVFTTLHFLCNFQLANGPDKIERLTLAGLSSLVKWWSCSSLTCKH